MLSLEEAKKLMDAAIERAKKMAEVGAISPKWLEAAIPVLGKDEHTVKLYILEGAPPKGYIIADYTLGMVKLFRKEDIRNVKTFKAYKSGEILVTDKEIEEEIEKDKEEIEKEIEKEKEEIEKEIEKEKEEIEKDKEKEKIDEEKEDQEIDEDEI